MQREKGQDDVMSPWRAELTASVSQGVVAWCVLFGFAPRDGEKQGQPSLNTKMDQVFFLVQSLFEFALHTPGVH